MAVDIVDPLEVIEVDQREARLMPLAQTTQVALGDAQKTSTVVQPSQLIGGGQVLQLPHHAAQGVLVRLQRIATLAHALAQAIYVTGEQAHPDQRHQQHAGL